MCVHLIFVSSKQIKRFQIVKDFNVKSTEWKEKKLKLEGKKPIQLLYRRVASSGNRVSNGGGSVCVGAGK